VAGTLKSQRGKGGGGIGPEETLIAPALVSRYGKGTDSDATDAMVVANALRSQERNTSQGPGNYVAAPLTKGSATGEGVNRPGRRQEDDVNIVAFNASGGGSKDLMPRDNLANPVTGSNGDPGAIAYALRKDPGGTGQGHNTNYVAESVVRRLTPTECERLQGFDDGWTQLGETSDSRRYSALGDAVTVNVSEWIGKRLPDAEPVE
jgi:site-specific DNA-cytosine methylase